jgi:hypothetical protein
MTWEQRKIKQQILRFIISHCMPSVKYVHLELFYGHKSKKDPLVAVLNVSVMESKVAWSIKSKNIRYEPTTKRSTVTACIFLNC